MDRRDPEYFRIDAAAAALRIRPHVQKTPLVASAWRRSAAGGQVLLKLENRQTTGSFKLRGAANKLLSLSKEAAARGVVTASNGNHALAVAIIGRRLGIATDIYVSSSVDAMRLEQLAELATQVKKVAGDCLLAETTARAEAESSGRVYVSPYNDLEVIAGQGTIAVEILEQTLEQALQVDAIFVAVGGGGLIGGIGAHLKRLAPTTEIVGCWPANSKVLYECLQAQRIIPVAEAPTLSSSTAGNLEPGSVTLPLALSVIDRRVLVSEEEILGGLRDAYEKDGELLEGSAGVALAGFAKVASAYEQKTVVIVLCGGNPDAALSRLITKKG